MTSHRYPPLTSPSQRDESDRVGEILDTVRRIEARMTATSERRAAIFAEVSKERERQEVKFPGQRLPLVEPDDEPGRIDLPRTVNQLAERERIDRGVCDSRAKHGSVTWLDVAREEFSEAMHALGKLQAGHGSKAEARAECVQTIAVLVRLLESEHFDDNVIAEGSYSKAQAPHKQPAASMVTKVTHRVGWTTGATGWRQHACMGCRIPFLVAPGDEPPKCYQCGSEATPTSAKEAEEFWSALDEVKP